MSGFPTKLVNHSNRKTLSDDASYRSKIKSKVLRLKNDEIYEKNSKKKSGQILLKNRFVHLKDEWISYELVSHFNKKTIFDDASYRSKTKSHFLQFKNVEIFEKNSEKYLGQILLKRRLVHLEHEWISYKIGESLQQKDNIWWRPGEVKR